MHTMLVKTKDQIWVSYNNQFGHQYLTAHALFERDISGHMIIELVINTQRGSQRTRQKMFVSYRAGYPYSLTQLFFTLQSGEFAQLHISVKGPDGYAVEYHWTPDLAHQIECPRDF
ncbi:hypothetical protein FH968_10615 [Buttiauxella sp. B2]|uniref:hypothetical protein n=1 Tax=Buttiauxella sp. B2 TaxID=2587812 RepID=UPI0011201A91|nr:hypothetical protein [Buttiauxella sp. B2]TNV20449.1 hypothetical protein FH968_10615 [Buttiauxella sp. B2]